MMKKLLLLTTMLTGIFLWSANLQAMFNIGPIKIDKEGPIVVELFTSQSCSSCPPADRVLREAAKNPNIIPLSFHVTYWNHLHWEDTLSRDFSTQRQRDYASQTFSGRVYTPQMVVNGDHEFVGSRSGDFNKAIQKTSAVKNIDISQKGGTLTLNLPDIEKGPYTIWAFGTKTKHIEDVRSGENGGRKLTYGHAVLTQDNLGPWDGAAKAVNIPISPFKEVNNIVVIVQKKRFGSVLAAGHLKL